MIAAIHQPHYLPWLRYFHKIASADVFILLDDVQYEKNGFQNRNRIKTPQGWSYLTAPVQRPTQVPIHEIRLDRSDWLEKHRRSLEMNYRKAPHFAAIWPELEVIYTQEWDRLVDLCEAMLKVFLNQLGCTVPLVRSSSLSAPGVATERLAQLCRGVGADTYLSGRYAVETYLDPEVLRREGIELVFQEWKAPEYSQLYPSAGFIGDLAIVDLLFNTGPEARNLLDGAGAVVAA